MRLLKRLVCTWGWLGLLALSALPASAWATQGTAAGRGEPAEARVADRLQALSRAHAAVVGVQAQAIEGAPSVDTLGAQRSGTGVVIGPDGLTLTIGYLILEAQQLQITTADGQTLPARTVAYDPATGFGLLKPLLATPALPAVPLGTMTGLQVGDDLLTFTGAGNDETAEVSPTRLMSQRPFSGAWEYHIEAALFTSPPIARHSGAALFNQRGELLGIGSLRVPNAADPNRRLPGNLFVPVDLLKPVLSELLQNGSSRSSRQRPWLGLNASDAAGRIQIVKVTEGGPAAQAGLQAGDLVLAVDGSGVSSLEGFYKTLWAHPALDQPVELTVLQGATLKQIRLQAIPRLRSLRQPEGI
ncbi:S1C family serine protease [Curvibacter sp. HBC61]|uniref:S1C family serine protease n=1 Tax=Curvibacter cyanobacteriorum TaxID=3026422 RepID=A0ABT5N2E7_9BURK|nr:S1C family serine protease [Curvibacter sp. HBC61]MDD0840484.1 S1C family serine protease [Curvibacter sp. HBC61]